MPKRTRLAFPKITKKDAKMSIDENMAEEDFNADILKFAHRILFQDEQPLNAKMRNELAVQFAGIIVQASESFLRACLKTTWDDMTDAERAKKEGEGIGLDAVLSSLRSPTDDKAEGARQDRATDLTNAILAAISKDASEHSEAYPDVGATGLAIASVGGFWSNMVEPQYKAAFVATLHEQIDMMAESMKVIPVHSTSPTTH